MKKEAGLLLFVRVPEIRDGEGKSDNVIKLAKEGIRFMLFQIPVINVPSTGFLFIICSFYQPFSIPKRTLI